MIIKITASLLSILMFTIPCLLNAQISSEIIEQARRDATTDVGGCAWICIGFLLNLIGVGAAYVIVPHPPAARLVGKSRDYVEVYILAYRRQARSKQVSNAIVGCIGVIAFEVFLFGVLKVQDSD